MSDFEDDNILVEVSSFKEKVKKSAKITLFKVITRSFFSVLTLTLILVYLLSPMGKVKINHLSGNFYLNSDDVLEIANLSKNDSLLGIKEEDIMKKLNNSSYIASSTVRWHMTYLDIEIDEVAAIAMSNNETILSNGISFTDYRIRHSDYQIPDNLSLPQYINYIRSNDSITFLNAMKYLDKSLFQKVAYLDERLVTFDGQKHEKYFGVYFRINEDLFRIQIEKTNILDAISETDLLLAAINSYDFNFNKMFIEELNKEVYEGLYIFDKKTNTYKIISLVERS